MALSSGSPTISVITVVRNDLRGLEITLASILIQTNNNFERLIVDGYSDDGTNRSGFEIAQKNLAKVITVPLREFMTL